MSWQTLPFLDVFRDATGGNIKTKQSEYLPTGAYPIVDQGKAMVGGYTDDGAALCKSGEPVIVFGDHTKALKYVDFPFCLGADGTKVLVPKVEADLKFLFYALHTIDIPEAGYSRHFKFLKRGEIPLPPLEEQRRIAGILDAADALRRRRREALALLDTLPGAIFAEMFGDPLVEPGDYVLRHLEEFVDPERKITYGILKPGPDIPEGVPYIRVVDMKDGTVRLDDLNRTTDEIAESYRRSSLRAGDLLMSIRGHVGRTATVPENCDGANITQDTARLALTKAIPEFIEGYLLLPSVQHWMAQRTKGVAVKGINLGDLKKLPVPMVPFERQDEFRSARKRVLNQRDAMAAHLSELETLFASLQSRAFAGEL
ncbi:restriction endonuclease subunit S [Oceaniglobus roseus]|uniref:restriction endonuclease subunit S n=1 Tax=Oceaniglobus roseus TaxID=1737570 RepID=UPI000C7F2AA7|nr:restriction endonuclease subunit S [Kandeliimicrobium roseum]